MSTESQNSPTEDESTLAAELKLKDVQFNEKLEKKRGMDLLPPSKPLTFMSRNNLSEYFLGKVTVAGNKKGIIREQLSEFGIHEKSMHPSAYHRDFIKTIKPL